MTRGISKDYTVHRPGPDFGQQYRAGICVSIDSYIAMLSVVGWQGKVSNLERDTFPQVSTAGAKERHNAN